MSMVYLKQKYPESILAQLTFFWEGKEFYTEYGVANGDLFHPENGEMSAGITETKGYEGRRWAVMGTKGIIGQVVALGELDK